MPETLSALVPILAAFASTAGAGYVASILLDYARAHLSPTTAAPLGRILHAPRSARILSLALAAVVSLLCSFLLATITGQDTSPALDAALAAIVGQLRHALLYLPAEPPEDA